MEKARHEAQAATLHQAMLAIANPTDQARSSWKRGRVAHLSALRRCKLRFMIAQRGFPGRLANALRWLRERKRAEEVHYLPPAAVIEAMNGCNLRCPECATGTAATAARRKGKAGLEDMKSVIDQVCGKCLQVSFHNLGEPLLNDDFYAACDYAVGRGLWTVIHSNLNIRSQDLARRIISCRLCNLVISCDGATPEVYEQYRVGGDVELVFRNLQDIVAEKRRAGRRLPWITAQFLVFEHNWHQMQRFQERALTAGADEILFLPGNRHGAFQSGHAAADLIFRLSELDWVEREPVHLCGDPWDTLIVTYDRGLYPCCFAYRDRDLFSAPREADTGTILERWNGPAYRAARRFFLGRSLARQDLPDPCRDCTRAAACDQGRTSVRAVPTR
ncbi:MAG: radical SAM protein [Planctomycetes bacterium]|jgi:MoaA/NifB/PqqE/SkfB family radical SAM enzyme|nr:radical SAM protein [Planctomycetota bacterium]